VIYGIGIGLVAVLGALMYAFYQKAKRMEKERDQAKATNQAWSKMYDISKEVSVPNVTPEERKKKEDEVKAIMETLGLAKEGEVRSGDPLGLRPPP
jgi:hypothetical protein